MKVKQVIAFIHQRITKNQFFSGSLVMILGINFYNLGQFLLHIVVGRSLGKAYYGDFAVLINILGMFALVQQSLGLTIVKFVSSQKNEHKVAGLIKWALQVNLIFGLVVAGLIILFVRNISEFLHISSPGAIYILAPLIIVGALAGIAKSSLQGLLKFGWFVMSMLGEVSLKLLLAVLFIAAGWAVSGAIAAVLLAVIFSLFIVFLPLRKYIFHSTSYKPEVSPLLKYSASVFLQAIALTSMYSTDLFLVKHFFNPIDAGLYAGLAKLGSIVFFAASPITQVMFPLISRRHSHGERYHNIFLISLLFVAGISGIVVLLYMLFPTYFLFPLGKSFLDGASILWWFGTFMGLLSIAMVFIHFYLSIGKIHVVWGFLVSAILQGVLIYFFHNSLLQIVQMSIFSIALLVIALFVYFPYHDRSQKHV